MADKTIAASYFANFLPAFVSQQLDFETLEHLPDSYMSKELRKTMSDIVYTCRKKGSDAEVKVSLLIEHKSYPDQHTPIQIGSYIFSALQKKVANKEPLSMVIPVLLYHGKQKWEYQQLGGLFENLEDSWKQFLPDFAYIYNSLGEMPDQQFEALENKFLEASLLALKHSFEKEWLNQHAPKILTLAGDGPKGLQKSLIVYLFGRSEMQEAAIRKIVDLLSVTLKDSVMSTLDIFIEKGRKEGLEVGMEKGLKTGIEKGRMEAEAKKNFEFVKNLLSTGNFSTAYIASLASVTEAFVLQVKQSEGL